MTAHAQGHRPVARLAHYENARAVDGKGVFQPVEEVTGKRDIVRLAAAKP